MKIAVIGGGVAGIVTSYLLSRKHDVEIFECNNYLGGHTNTIEIESGADKGLAVDTGFIVLNDKNYPNFQKFLKQLEVPIRYSDMSFSFFSEQSGLQYAGTTLNGLFAQRKNILSPQFYKFLLNFTQFCLTAQRDLKEGIADIPLGEYLSAKNTSQYVIDNFLLPMGAAIWSAPLDSILEFPAKSFLHFFKNHGLLSIRDRPKWQTVVGGSHSYVKKFQTVFHGKINLNTKINRVLRKDSSVEIIDSMGHTQTFDKVVFATHADQTLTLLDTPSELEQNLLGTWNYQRNHTVLHTDISLLAPNARAWASWNYTKFNGVDGKSKVAVTYDMNRLQGLRSKNRYCVTLNCTKSIKPETIIKEISYLHPVFNFEAIETQKELGSLNNKNGSYFCGSYFGYGFHEDAVSSALKVAEEFGIYL